MDFSETTQNCMFAFIYSFLGREFIAALGFSKGSILQKVKNCWPRGGWNCDRVHEHHSLQPQPQVPRTVALVCCLPSHCLGRMARMGTHGSCCQASIIPCPICRLMATLRVWVGIVCCTAWTLEADSSVIWGMSLHLSEPVSSSNRWGKSQGCCEDSKHGDGCNVLDT